MTLRHTGSSRRRINFPGFLSGGEVPLIVDIAVTDHGWRTRRRQEHLFRVHIGQAILVFIPRVGCSLRPPSRLHKNGRLIAITLRKSNGNDLCPLGHISGDAIGRSGFSNPPVSGTGQISDNRLKLWTLGFTLGTPKRLFWSEINDRFRPVNHWEGADAEIG